MSAGDWLNSARRIRRALLETRYSVGSQWRKAPGTNPDAKPEVVVSLTSYGKRLERVQLCLESLLSQSYRPSRIVLWQPEPLQKLPKGLTGLARRGVEIRHVKDLGPATKILYALQEFPTSLVVTADDDLAYSRNWLRKLIYVHNRYPTHIVCHRGHWMTWEAPRRLRPYSQWDYESPGRGEPSLLLFPTGVSGVLYPPNSLHPDVLDIELNRKVSVTNDDVWLKVMSLRAGTPCVKVAPYSTNYYVLQGTQDAALWKTNAVPTQRAISSLCELFDLETHLWEATSDAPD